MFAPQPNMLTGTLFIPLIFLYKKYPNVLMISKSYHNLLYCVVHRVTAAGKQLTTYQTKALNVIMPEVGYLFILFNLNKQYDFNH